MKFIYIVIGIPIILIVASDRNRSNIPLAAVDYAIMVGDFTARMLGINTHGDIMLGVIRYCYVVYVVSRKSKRGECQASQTGKTEY
jgi:hypothetical protein